MVDMKMKKAICCFYKEPSFLLFGFYMVSDLKVVFFQDSCFCIFAKVGKNKEVDDFRNF